MEAAESQNLTGVELVEEMFFLSWSNVVLRLGHRGLGWMEFHLYLTGTLHHQTQTIISNIQINHKMITAMEENVFLRIFI